MPSDEDDPILMSGAALIGLIARALTLHGLNSPRSTEIAQEICLCEARGDAKGGLARARLLCAYLRKGGGSVTARARDFQMDFDAMLVALPGDRLREIESLARL